MSYQHQNAFTNLDQDVQLTRLDKYAKGESEIKQWIFQVLQISKEEVQEYHKHNQDLVDILKDGRILCELGNLMVIPNNPTKKFKNSKMPFVQMENISFFLKTCEMIGVPHDEIFQTVDLFDRKDPYQIIITLISFSRFANHLNPSIPVIGPKVAKIKPNVPNKPLRLRS